MARRVIETLIDDIDGTVAVRSIYFTLNDAAFEIDLSEANSERFNEALAPFIQNARHARVRTPAAKPAKTLRVGQDRLWNANDVREWCKAEGIEVNLRGRVPGNIVEKYLAAHPR